MNRHLLIGLEGLRLSARERRWLQEKPPRGVILFGRNIQDAVQVRALLAEVREAAGQALWAAIDEEGGRVNRLLWPPFSTRRPAASYGRMYAHAPEEARQHVYDDAFKVGRALRDLGFTHNCAPVLDVFHADGHGVIGDRAFGGDVEVVCQLALECMNGLAEAGVEAVGKHFPGHGRANADSHHAMPYVDAGREELLREAQPFRHLTMAGLQHIMTAHVVYPEVDQRIVTFSSTWLMDILRQELEFSGQIWSDDLSMKGTGQGISLAVESALAAGCDVLLVCEPADVAAVYASL